ncbi:YXWGXW repeat-containing protein [Cupriavidus sp. P-10]|uniref:YXWGXW repeat-containing protein n=1 Tax=Cupriavidus sp. P-10 TaxID=2027911 RepID=UPI000E2F37A9|nr:YXWGXW repeat-containing protein [Cupriavidus sp. P-10]BDB24827.1 YXWGXW repeat-containing protein [Cupriavidus sp. P-10]
MTHLALRPVRTILLAAVLGSGLAFSAASMAQVSVNIAIGVPPPAPMYEAIPAPRPGYVWMPGYWDWDDHHHKHAWKKGRWDRERPGYVYESPRWVQSRDGWVLVPGRWDEGGHKGKGNGKGNKKDYHCPPGHAKKGEC